MSANHYSRTVIGVRIEERNAYQNRVVRTFEHNHPANWKVDPETGTALWREERIVVLPFEKWESRCHDNNFSVSYLESSQEKRGPVYVGICREADYRSSGAFIPFFGFSAEDLIMNLKTNLEPLGLWNELNFGIWTFPYVSY